MGRFYQATRVNFADYIDDLATETPQIGPIDSSLGTVEVLPQDRPIAGQKIGQYEQELNRITQALQRGANVQQVQPQIQDLRSRIRQDYQYGELAAMRDRLAKVRDLESNVSEVLKDYPTLRDTAITKLRQSIQPAGFVQETGEYNVPSLPTNIVRPFSQDDINEWMSTVKSNLKEKILEEAQAQELDVSKFDSIWEVGRKVGIDETRANEIVVGSIPREGLDAAQMVADLTGTGVNERMFIDPQTGRFNENTQWGRLASSLFNQIQSEDFEGNILKREDFGAKQAERLRGQKEMAYLRKNLSGKDASDAAENLASKFINIWKGNPDAYDMKEVVDGSEIALMDNFLQGQIIGDRNAKDSPTIVRVRKTPTGDPVAVVRVPKTVRVTKDMVKKDGEYTSKDIGKEITTYTEEPRRLDLELMRSTIPDEEVFDAFVEKLKERGAIDPETQQITIQGLMPSQQQPTGKVVPGIPRQ